MRDSKKKKAAVMSFYCACVLCVHIRIPKCVNELKCTLERSASIC